MLARKLDSTRGGMGAFRSACFPALQPLEECVRYSRHMDIAAILREIDAELDKLMQVRRILSELIEPSPQKRVRAKRATPRLPQPAAEPQIIVLPPKLKREYHRRVKQHVPEPRAIGGAVPNAPVVVRKITDETAVPVRVVSIPEQSLESVMRSKLLGGAA